MYEVWFEEMDTGDPSKVNAPPFIEYRISNEFQSVSTCALVYPLVYEPRTKRGFVLDETLCQYAGGEPKDVVFRIASPLALLTVMLVYEEFVSV